jgi:DNA repair REX1-B
VILFLPHPQTNKQTNKRSGLMVVLETGNMTFYPNVCFKATAAFSVLSDSIKEIQVIFQSRKRPDLSKLIQQLQILEKEKLHLTAAHHLERIRERDYHPHPQQQSQEGEKADLRIQKLLKEGVASLQQKIHKTILAINEVIDEIRCALIDEEEGAE